MKPRIRQSKSGNWCGYVGNRKVEDFGTNKYWAKAWLANSESRYEAQKLAAVIRGALTLDKDPKVAAAWDEMQFQIQYLIEVHLLRYKREPRRHK